MASSWERLASVTLGSSNDVIDTANDSSFSGNNFTAKKHLRVVIHTIASGVTNHAIRYNANTEQIYCYRRSGNGTGEGAEQSQTSDPSMSGSVSTSSFDAFAEGSIINTSGIEKVAWWDTSFSGVAGTSNAPMRREGICKWAKTSEQITRISVTNDSGGDYDTGSSITVWGTEDQASTPFYPNIPNGTIFEESDTGKHYMFDGTDTWNEMT